MLKFLRISVVLGGCILAALITASVLPAQAQPVRSAISPAISVAEIEGFPFPKTLGNFTRQSKVDYKTPGLGFSVTYLAPSGAWADIYVYDKQLKLPTGPALPQAKRELDFAISDVGSALKSGAYQDAKLLDSSASGSFAMAHMKITQRGTERDSYIFVTLHDGMFVKIRVTADSGAGARRMAQDLVADYRRILDKR
ncbi:hypothetical protein [Microvirga arabica]|nr:hypothetical protein [Microvirga arabica]MBM1174800.1 hypothetical protein [Microvirga arabica]